MVSSSENRPRGRSTRIESDDLATESDDPDRERIDRDLERQDRGPGRVGADQRRWATRGALRRRALLPREVERHEVAKHRADAAASETRASHQLGAGQRPAEVQLA